MSRDTWATTMFGIYLDNDDIAGTFPEAEVDGDPGELEELIQTETKMDVCTHLVDGQVIGVGIGFQIIDSQNSDDLIAGVKEASELLKKCKILKSFAKKPQVITMENDDGG